MIFPIYEISLYIGNEISLYIKKKMKFLYSTMFLNESKTLSSLVTDLIFVTQIRHRFCPNKETKLHGICMYVYHMNIAVGPLLINFQFFLN